ncbi:metal ABC transporter solute-binding protein, Zn/Mn family [Spirochaetota bacterium]
MKRIIPLFLMTILILSCGGRIGKGKDIITVTILPQKYFVEKIAGDKYTVNVMVPPGSSPATYEPTPKQLQDLLNSKLYFMNGHLPFEKAWGEKIKEVNKGMSVIDTSVGVNIITGSDPHIWLSPREVKVQVNHMYQAFMEVDPDNAEKYTSNFNSFTSQIDKLDQRIRSILRNISKRTFMVFHPAWSYFARDYGLTQFAIEREGKAPNPGTIKSLVDTARREGISTIFIQKQFDTHSARIIASEISGKLVVLDHLGENWFENLEVMAEAFNEAFK